MNLSIFDNDQTLGDVPAGSRVVTLRGTTTVSQLFSPRLFSVDQWMKTGLENRGFSVNAVRTSFAAWLGYEMNVEIELNVFNEFTAEQVRANAIQAIDQITANYGLNQVFFNTTLSVTYDGSGSPQVQSPPSDYDRTQDGGGSGFSDNLGLGLGISTPFVLLGAGVIALIILRR